MFQLRLPRKDLIALLALGLLALLSLGHMFSPGGLPVGHDLSFETVRLVEYRDALLTQVIPRYAPHTYGGLGSPVFLFYSPLFVLGASVLSFLTGSLTTSVGLWFALLKLASVLAVFGLVRRFAGTYSVALLAVLWCFLPYGYTDLYQRNAFSEATALFLLPLLAYSLTNLTAWWRFGLASLLAMLFFLSHNITVMLAALVALFFATLWGVVFRRFPWQQTIPVALGGGMAAWFLLPAFFEKDTVHIQDVTLGKFLYSNNFVSLQDLLLAVDHEGFLGPVYVLLLLLGAGVLAYLATKKLLTNKHAMLGIGLLLMLGSAFMMTSWSAPLWQIFPFLSFMQFPWRLQIFASLGLLVTLLGLLMAMQKRQLVWLLAALVLGQSLYVGWYKFLRVPMHHERLDAVTTEMIAENSMKATVGEEYLPVTVSEVLPLDTVRPLFREGNLAAIPDVAPILYLACGAELPKAPLSLHAYSFLKLYYDGQPLPANSDGLLTVPVHVSGVNDNSCAVLVLGFTPLQKLGFLISFLSFAALCAGLLAFKRLANLPAFAKGL